MPSTSPPPPSQTTTTHSRTYQLLWNAATAAENGVEQLQPSGHNTLLLCCVNRVGTKLLQLQSQGT